MRKLFILSFAVVILTACSDMQPISSEEIVDDMGTQEMIDMETDMEMEGDDGEPVEGSVLELDESSLVKDFSCDSLEDSVEVENCRNEINYLIAQMLQEEIVSAYDLNRCDELDGVMIDNCRLLIEETGIKGPISKEDRQLLQEAMQRVYTEVQGEDDNEVRSEEGYYDINKCDALSASNGLQAYCKGRVQERIDNEKVWEIVLNGTVEDCSQLSDTARQMCEFEFGVYDDVVEEVEEPSEGDAENTEEAPVPEEEMVETVQE
jgi:hypothetical protein